MEKFNNIFNKETEEAKNVRLSHSEKQEMRNFLDEHVLSNPITDLSAKSAIGSSGASEKKVRSPFWNFGGFSIFRTNFTAKYRMAFQVAFAFIFLFTGGVYASERALPGDILYPIKILTENVRVSLASMSEEKATLNAENALKRLDEIQELQTNGKLDAKTKADLENSFIKSSAESMSHIENLKKKNPEASANISRNFEAQLLNHQKDVGSTGVGVKDKNTLQSGASPSGVDNNEGQSAPVNMIMSDLEKIRDMATSTATSSAYSTGDKNNQIDVEVREEMKSDPEEADKKADTETIKPILPGVSR